MSTFLAAAPNVAGFTARPSMLSLETVMRELRAGPPLHVCRPLLITGDRSTELAQLSYKALSLLPGCVLHLYGDAHARKEVARAENPRVLLDSSFAAASTDFEDIMYCRPAGIFRLALPAQAYATRDLGELINEQLLGAPGHFHAYCRGGQPGAPLTVVLHDWRSWLPLSLLRRLLTQGSSLRMQLVLTDRADQAVGYLHAFGHVLSYRTSCEPIANALGVPLAQLQSLPVGEALYSSRVRRSTNKGPAMVIG
jgi:hypothetical protein